jgi:FkbM family methyltransferase
MADPSKTIGRSIWTTGVYDLTVSEVLARLIRPGDTMLDAGANVGYMTVLAGLAAGTSGRVLAWEPHPELYAVLQQNVRSIPYTVKHADIRVRNAALGETPQKAHLVVPREVDANDGLSFIGEASGIERSIPVIVETIDQAIGLEQIAVMKLDVEGSELRVLEGAADALLSGRVTHVVFEDHAAPTDSKVIRLLLSRGYEVFSVGWSWRGLRLGPWTETLAAPYEAPSYIASLAPDEVRDRCSRTGWMTLRASFARTLRVDAARAEPGRQCA